MDIDFVNVVRNDFEDLAINANAASIHRAEFGFVNTNCDFIKSMLGTICIHALDNPDIFNNIQFNNIVSIINKLSYD